jgi:4-hydroxy-3-methylbut-2-en-1-yl diphosphate reductase
VSGRENKLAEFAAENDVVIFVAGRTSSNGKVLFNVAKQANARTYFIEDVAELEDAWFDGVETVGISGATSTPQWYMEQTAAVIREKYDTEPAL